MVFDKWLHEAILLAELFNNLRSGNRTPRHVAIGFACPDPLCATCAAAKAQRFDPKYGRIGHKGGFRVNLLTAIKQGKCCYMRKPVASTYLREAVLVLHVTIVRTQARVQSRKGGKIIPKDVFVHVLALIHFVKAIERVFDWRNTVAQREPVHIEDTVWAMQ